MLGRAVPVGHHKATLYSMEGLMRAVLLGLLAGALLATNADAQKNLQSANYMVPGVSKLPSA
jgi:hypothetical protein